ncbi:MAG: hypothetical protein QNK36_17625 [Colwellia sp.]|nr:hypothetical protein [Colwellia sp.]
MYYLKNGFIVYAFSLIPFSIWYAFDNLYLNENCDTKLGCVGTFQLLLLVLASWSFICVLGHLANLVLRSRIKVKPNLKLSDSALLGVIYSLGHSLVFTYAADVLFILFSIVLSGLLSYLVCTLRKI